MSATNFQAANLSTFAAKNLGVNTARRYLMIVATTAMTVKLASSAVAFTIATGDNWAPHVCPTSAVTITGTGVMVSDYEV